jgi:hypothetical protein
MLATATAWAGSPTAPAADAMVPFVIPMTPNPASLIAMKSPPIPVDAAPLAARDGHFFCGDRRVRIWGVNTCFGGSFPTHADAERMAERLAAGGVNSIRFHHMDTSPYPAGILDPKDPMKLSVEALDRLDYLVDQLARRGIYANVNLHVGRTASKALGLPKPDTDYDKIVGIFTPQLIEAQKQYARDLLTHVNAYRKVRYADDPAVGFVEITNEDSFFMWDGEEKLRALPEFYAKILREKYAAWLKARYKDTAGLRAAWAKGAEPLGTTLLVPLDVKGPADAKAKAWAMEQHEGCTAKAVHPADNAAALRLEISKADGTGWHLQLKCRPLVVKEGQYYTLTFRARADEPRELSYGVGQDHDPWGGLGLWGSVKLTKEWQTVRAGFAATATDDNVRLSFSFGASAVAVELADVSLAPGGREGLQKDESIEAASVALYGPGEVEARALDRLRFLAETEKAYFDGMRSFIKKDLGAKALVTGTIVFGPCGLYAQSGMDYVDAHAYWQHPHFPGRPWDQGNWTVEQVAMVDKPEQSTLPGLSACRLDGKPFTVSEYNHPAPNDYQAECVPMLSAWAAAQDWDGIWLFAYSHRASQADHEFFDSFFDIDSNPAKWGFMPAGAAIFREGGVQPLRGGQSNNLCSFYIDPLEAAARLHLECGSNMVAAASGGRHNIQINRHAMQGTELAVNFGPGGRTWYREGAGADVNWGLIGDMNIFVVVGRGAAVLVAHEKSGGPDFFAAITVTAMDGKDLATSGSILLTICGRCENTGMQFSVDRRTVGRNWGKAPVRIEAIDYSDLVQWLLNHSDKPAGTFKPVALAPDGTQRAEVKLGGTPGDAPAFKPSAEYKTMWYLLTPAEKKEAK